MTHEKKHNSSQLCNNLLISCAYFSVTRKMPKLDKKTPMTSTERSRRYRAKLKENDEMAQQAREKDKYRKRVERSRARSKVKTKDALK